MAYIYQLLDKKGRSHIAAHHDLGQIWPDLISRSRSGESDSVSNIIRALGESSFTLRLLEECEDQFTDIRIGYYIRRIPQTLLQYANGKKPPRKGERFEITTPKGVTIQIMNLSRFCRENGLSKGHMCTVAQGKRKKHHGYKVKKLCSDQEKTTIHQPN